MRAEARPPKLGTRKGESAHAAGDAYFGELPAPKCHAYFSLWPRRAQSREDKFSLFVRAQGSLLACWT